MIQISNILFILLAFLLLVSFSVSLYLYIKLMQQRGEIKMQQNHINELEHKVYPLQLEVLEAKLNPHLFKNILNSIQSHAFQTYHAIDKLAGVLDYILYESRKRMVTVREEMDFAINFIEVNKVKVSPLFDLTVKNQIDVNDPLYDQPLLLPLVTVDLIENAFKHADLQHAGAYISIVAELKDHCFVLTVANKISVYNPLKKENSGIGLESLKQRLKMVYGELYSLQHYTESEDTFVAQLKIDILEYKIKMLTA